MQPGVRRTPGKPFQDDSDQGRTPTGFRPSSPELDGTALRFALRKMRRVAFVPRVLRTLGCMTEGRWPSISHHTRPPHRAYPAATCSGLSATIMPVSPHPDLGGDLTKLVIGVAMTVHRTLGPGLDEADYERALHLELLDLGIEHECQAPPAAHLQRRDARLWHGPLHRKLANRVIFRQRKPSAQEITWRFRLPSAT
jgi:hypothetical protein